MKEGGVKLAPTVDMDKHTNTTNHTGLSILFTSTPPENKWKNPHLPIRAPADIPTKQKRPTCLNLTAESTRPVLERQDSSLFMQEGSSAT